MLYWNLYVQKHKNGRKILMNILPPLPNFVIIYNTFILFFSFLGMETLEKMISTPMLSVIAFKLHRHLAFSFEIM